MVPSPLLSFSVSWFCSSFSQIYNGKGKVSPLLLSSSSLYLWHTSLKTLDVLPSSTDIALGSFLTLNSGQLTLIINEPELIWKRAFNWPPSPSHPFLRSMCRGKVRDPSARGRFLLLEVLVMAGSWLAGSSCIFKSSTHFDETLNE